MEEVAEEVRETYPFHPSFKNLVALFKENEGFRQTRGLMQFTARCVMPWWTTCICARCLWTFFHRHSRLSFFVPPRLRVSAREQ
jgi:hypothetical protein